MPERKRIEYQEFLNRENGEFHAPYEEEFQFYHAVQIGDVEQVRQLLHVKPMHEKEGLGTLSANMLQSLKYHFAISAALVARYCIEGGMQHETAYLMSDYYIAKADVCRREEEISNLVEKMMLDYAERMLEWRSKGRYTKPVRECMEYIYKNLHTTIRLEALADALRINPSQLSKQFKKEVGMPVSKYIMQMKLNTAKNMLLYSEYSIAEIAAVFAFSSQSHFTDVFHKYFGETPLQCRMASVNAIADSMIDTSTVSTVSDGV